MENVARLHQELKIPLLKDRKDVHLKCICHKNVHGETQTGLNSMFNRVDLGNRQMRQVTNPNMIVAQINSVKGRMVISYRGPAAWNTLSAGLKTEESYNTFKNAIYAKMMEVWDNHPT